ncbi:unnamed protein product [marine sediment metagenome]|uniref:Uncharacterized protein n=1 Tax=marine sediment metagenome TaxID=412755 RepID=X1CPV6_9ZZZZ
MAKEKAFFGATKSEIARFKREVEKDTGVKQTSMTGKRKKRKKSK